MRNTKNTSIFDRLDPPINLNRKLHSMNIRTRSQSSPRRIINTSTSRKILQGSQINKSSQSGLAKSRSVFKNSSSNTNNVGSYLYNSALKDVLDQTKNPLRSNKAISLKRNDINGPTQSSVFVRNLPKNCTEQQIERLFKEVGTISMLKLEKGPLPTAFVGFNDPNGADICISNLDGYLLGSSAIKISTTQNSFSNSYKGSEGFGFDTSFVPSETKRKSIFDRMT